MALFAIKESQLIIELSVLWKLDFQQDQLIQLATQQNLLLLPPIIVIFTKKETNTERFLKFLGIGFLLFKGFLDIFEHEIGRFDTAAA